MLWLLLIPTLILLSLAALWVIGERGHLMLPSTREALTSRQDGGRGGLWNALHGYVYGRWCYQYIKFFVNRVAPRMSSGFKRVWAEHYHGKVLPTNLACEIIRLDHDIERTDLEHIIPYSTARDIVLTSSPGVTLLECPCRAARDNPCRPTQVCMLVGGGDWVLEHHPDRARRATQQEALELLQAEHERGHVHTAYFKDACDHRFYAICNCCRCCCGGLIAMQRHAVPMVASSGFVAEVDEGACIACGDCEEACPFDAITVNGRAAVTWESCMGCGVCEGQCGTGAIALVRDERKGIPLDVRKIGLGLPPGVREAAMRGSVPELSHRN